MSGAVAEFRVLDRYPGLLIFRDGRVLLRGSLRRPAMKEIKPERKGGYFQLSIRNAITGEKDYPYLTRLVAEAFCFPPAGVGRDDCEVHHIDSNPHNNAADNLEYLPVHAHRLADKDLRELARHRGAAMANWAAAVRALGAEVAESIAYGGMSAEDALGQWQRATTEINRRRDEIEERFRPRPSAELRAFVATLGDKT